ncbi:unnamed protein product [Tetraodon nigroviridis]|uniref:Chromosome undetermined SCAF14784, whole genome shotgun sequence n=1 Tax=Tetraodon nigroviridis TaxID=99883 RepID=Q4S095_TETNG|nr:unnamed protein product [Tetraodon nigroviridis]
MSAAKTLISQRKYFSFRKKIPTKQPNFFSTRKKLEESGNPRCMPGQTPAQHMETFKIGTE